MKGLQGDEKTQTETPPYTGCRSQVTVSARPPRMKITPEEAIKRTETFAMERKEQFIAAVRNGKKTSG